VIVANVFRRVSAAAARDAMGRNQGPRQRILVLRQDPAIVVVGGVRMEEAASAEDRFAAWARQARTGETFGPWRVMRTRSTRERFLTKDAARPANKQVTHHYGDMCPHRPSIPTDERLPFIRIGGPDDGDNGIMHAAPRCHRTIERIQGRPMDLDLPSGLA